MLSAAAGSPCRWAEASPARPKTLQAVPGCQGRSGLVLDSQQAPPGAALLVGAAMGRGAWQNKKWLQLLAELLQSKTRLWLFAMEQIIQKPPVGGFCSSVLAADMLVCAQGSDSCRHCTVGCERLWLQKDSFVANTSQRQRHSWELHSSRSPACHPRAASHRAAGERGATSLTRRAPGGGAEVRWVR